MRALIRFCLLWLLSVAPVFAYKALVVSVHDGDSVRIQRQMKGSERVRLAGIDAPELTQPLGYSARAVTEHLTLNQMVDVHVRGRDRYGRILAEITTGRGVSVNRELVRQGLAWWYQAFAPSDKVLEQLQCEAYRKRLGVWATPSRLAPWDYRRELRAGGKTTEASLNNKRNYVR